MTQQFDEQTDISYGDMEKQGFQQSFINDYQSLKRALRPLTGSVLPENNIRSNLSGFYVRTGTVQLWFNSTPGVNTGWVQIV